MSTERERTPSPTISEVAEAAGVGRATVARTLGGYGSVSPKTRDRILAAAKELGYRPNSIARSMTTGETRTLGVVLADVGNPFFAGVLRGISDAAREAGYDVIVLSTDESVEQEAAAIEVLVDKQVDGIALAPAAGRRETLPHLDVVAKRGIPLVLLDRLVDTVAADAVVINNREASREAVEALIAQGHRRIGFVWGPVTNEPAADADDLRRILDHALWSDGERLLGYLDALERAGIPFDTSLVTHVLKNEQQATRAVLGMLALSDAPTAIFATETDALTGALRAMRQRGLLCPEDISLIGFDDSSWASVMTPPMSVVAQPMHRLGVLTAECLLARVAGSDAPVATHVLEASFIARDSVAPAAR
ncbi:LacI family DNA-binding transcriptional regulator [Leifsonia sp. F6_8S_P_1B]|uniref:LacI family DNA-binding transcriptional regulator n=1 Tax=Leifsonia williamsii TaxID=3035919 RepID=A0ABT8K9I6_9MICO|nr:LacI family DNA-binding transcriptional regulator [Leifsonia williamsii]MDN4614059.1 LacI family DNA-binding transcriptional regulator [Leifsonia williamsii]